MDEGQMLAKASCSNAMWKGYKSPNVCGGRYGGRVATGRRKTCEEGILGYSAARQPDSRTDTQVFGPSIRKRSRSVGRRTRLVWWWWCWWFICIVVDLKGCYRGFAGLERKRRRSFELMDHCCRDRKISMAAQARRDNVCSCLTRDQSVANCRR